MAGPDLAIIAAIVIEHGEITPAGWRLRVSDQRMVDLHPGLVVELVRLEAWMGLEIRVNRPQVTIEGHAVEIKPVLLLSRA